MITVENLVKTYGKVKALDGLSLEVGSGVVYGFLGPNGAGKTTTMRILSGLARADAGRATILGQPVGGFGQGQADPGAQISRDIRMQIGVLPEEPAFYPWMTAREYLRDFVCPLYRMSKEQAASRSAEMLERVGLSEAADRRIGGFSKGMRQRLGLAQATIHRPPVLLLDEPVSALDPAGRKEVLELIGELRGHSTILLSTHILADVERVCDVIGIIARGRMVVQSGREELLARYVLPLFEVEIENGIQDWAKSIRDLSTVQEVSVNGGTARVLVKEVAAARKELLSSLLKHGANVRRFEVVRPSLEDVFLRLTGEYVPNIVG